MRDFFNEIKDLELLTKALAEQKTVLHEALSEASESDSSRTGGQPPLEANV
jgi:hypothetical protein